MPPKSRRRETGDDEDVSQRRNGSSGTRRRHSDASEAENEDPDVSSTGTKQGVPESDIVIMVKNLIRLALACEHTRTPIRREDISKKVIINDHKRCFQVVYDRTQTRLKKTLGMQLVELPARDRSRAMTMTQQRKAAHTQASNATSQSTSKPSKSWILQNLLPPRLKQISQRQHMEWERNYNAVVTVLLIIVVMSDDQTCTESRAMSALERLGWIPDTPAGPFDDIVAKMIKQGYLERLKDDQSMDGNFSFFVGTRGKLETLQNRDELFSVISTIYGTTEDEEATSRLKRIIQDTLDGDDDVPVADSGYDDDYHDHGRDTQTQTQEHSAPQAKRKKVFREQIYENEED